MSAASSKKLNLTNRAEAAAYAVEHNLKKFL